MFLWTAFLIGLVGSFHCAGMCGPIALALPLDKGSWFDKIAGGLIYNSGRIITYMILGALFGLLGTGVFEVPLGKPAHARLTPSASQKRKLTRSFFNMLNPLCN